MMAIIGKKRKARGAGRRERFTNGVALCDTVGFSLLSVN
jgi:hypothetical protein